MQVCLHVAILDMCMTALFPRELNSNLFCMKFTCKLQPAKRPEFAKQDQNQSSSHMIAVQKIITNLKTQRI